MIPGERRQRRRITVANNKYAFRKYSSGFSSEHSGIYFARAPNNPRYDESRRTHYTLDRARLAQTTTTTTYFWRVRRFFLSTFPGENRLVNARRLRFGVPPAIRSRNYG